MKSRQITFLALYICFRAAVCSQTAAQPRCYIEHYGAENGLPQHTVMDIVQDQKGFMWFGTWDGLSKFDGYDFTTYRIPHSNDMQTRSNRIDHLFTDAYGNVWILLYDKKPYRFNPRSETFTGVKSLTDYNRDDFSAVSIVPLKSGNVWLLSETDGCICITDSLFNAKIYNRQNGKLPGNTVYMVHEDQNSNSWILTDKGLVCVSAQNPDIATDYFNEPLPENNTNLPFFSVCELDEFIWFGSKDGKIWRYNKNDETFYLLDLPTDGEVTELKEISSEKILVVTRKDGFFIYNTHDESWNTYNRNTLSTMVSNVILNSYIDKSRNVWFETDRLGVSKFNPYTEEFTHFSPLIESTESSVFPPKFFIFEDKENRLWIHPRGGGFSMFDKETNTLTPFYNKPFSQDWLFSNMLHAAYSDRQGNLWLSTRSHGLEKVIFYESNFRPFVINENMHSTISNDVRPIFQDSRQQIWIATKDGRIYVLDADFRQKGFLCHDGTIGNATPLKGIAYTITEDSKNRMWIGTKGEGVYRLDRTPSAQHFTVTHYENDPADTYSLSDDNVYSIFEDKSGRIWIGTYGGGINLLKTDASGTKFIHSGNELRHYPRQSGAQVRVIASDARGNICVGTTLGFIMFAPEDNIADTQFNVYLKADDADALQANDILDICTTRKGDTYIGIFGGGISRIEETDARGFPLKFRTYTTYDGLPSNITLSLLEDDLGNVWISTEGNLTKFNPGEESFENFSEVKRLMKRKGFSENSRWKIHNGQMLFGYSNGIMIFTPKNLNNNTFTPYLSLSQFKLFNKTVSIGKKSPLKTNIDDTDKLRLKHSQNFFGIEFAALDYAEPANIFYAYKLEGFDKDWIYSGNLRTANYTNLSRGKYVFKVKSTNSDGVWVNNERVLPIEIRPPFWATVWAYIAYFVLAAVILYYSLKILYAFYRMRNKIVLEKRESEIKTRFFTDISHEIRTPLTMIVSPIENMLQNDATPETVKKQLKLVSKNTSRLLNMVNQILDFQKIQQKTLTIEKIEIGELAEEICRGFVKTAEVQHIDFSTDNAVGRQTIWADPESVEKIIFNLLSNAFKYTPQGKSVKVRVFEDDQTVSVQIADEGKGIDAEKQTRIFKRFESFNEDKSKPSTGIGLSIVKELADRHKALVLVKSEVGKGSVFTVLFLKGFSHFGADTVVQSKEKADAPHESPLAENTEMPSPPESVGKTKPCILVVEDDEDLRAFICSTLETDYDVHPASNGKEGLQLANELIPDFIVSDIMMPEVDGIGFLQGIRNNINTSHILFLLLTAKTTLDSKIEGFEHGADEYITKPFSVSYFKARVKNLLRRQQELQKHYRQTTTYVSPASETAENASVEKLVNRQDEEFMRTVNAFIQKNMDNSDFVVEDLATELGMSRTVFFKKLKGLTGLSPIEHIRNIAMQKAAGLLVEGDFAVKEVAYMVGISDTKYFTKCFKKQFGVTPTEYKKSNKTIQQPAYDE